MFFNNHCIIFVEIKITMEELKESILTLSKFYGIEPTELIYFLERNTSNEKNVMIPKTLRDTNQYLLETCKEN